jgi:acetyltransferase
MADVQRVLRWRGLDIEPSPVPLPVDRPRAAAVMDGAPSGYLGEEDALAVLEAYGFPVPRHRLCRTPDEAVAFADQIGYPVVLRLVSPQVLHKFDVKGVALDLPDAASVGRTFRQMVADISRQVPEAEITGLIVRRMIPAGHEVILGAKRDAVFGPTLMFGLGGLFVEIFKDVTFALAPIDRHAAARMVREVRAYRLLQGARGMPGADVAGIEQCLLRLSQLVSDFERITELDINPLIVGPASPAGTGGEAPVTAVADVRIRLK